jgi:thiol-disulfide isomerase/thioredoxin
MKNILPIAIALVLALSACAAPAAEPAIPAVESAPEILDEPQAAEPVTGAELPAESAADLPDWYGWPLAEATTGESFRISHFQGKVVLVETMAVWCSNCFRQQTEVARLLEALDGRDDLVSLGINIDPNEDSALLSDYVSKNGFDWLYTVAPPELIEEISLLYGPQYLNPPSSPMLIIDRQGEAHLLPFGTKSAEDLQGFLAPFLDGSG